MKEIELKRYGNELVYSPEICLYDGEGLKLNLNNILPDIESFKAAINGVMLGSFKGTILGIHASKLKDGLNTIEIEPLNSDMTFTIKLVRMPGMRTMNSCEQEIVKIFKRLDAIDNVLDKIHEWQEEINNERSGY